MLFLAESVSQNSPASHLLAGVFALAFLAILFVNSWRGYWRGPIRSVAPLVAFIFAGAAAWLFGSDLGFAFLGDFGIPWILRGLFGILLTGILVWLPVFGLLWMWGRKQISEKTGEPESPIFGAIVGCWTGFFWIGVCVLALTSVGALGESLSSGPRKNAGGFWAQACRCAVTVRHSVALVPGFRFADTWNPLPESTVRQIDKLVAVLSDTSKARKFIFTAEVQSVVSLPAVYPVIYSPRIQAMAAARDIDGILADPAVNRMLDDEDFQRALAEIDFERLLDQTLAQ